MASRCNPLTNGSVWTAIWLTCLFFIYGHGDPFGAKKAAARQSDAVQTRLFSGPWYQSEARDKITVILLDDAFIAQQRDAWPLSYQTQEWLLSTIASYQPEAIYLDFLYRQRHHKTEPIHVFGDTISSLSAQLPVQIPMLVNSGKYPGSCESELMGAGKVAVEDLVDQKSVIDEIRATGASFSYIGWNNCGEKYPAKLYGNKELPTPAYALLDAVCETNPDFSESCGSLKKPGNYDEPMHIVWGAGVSEDHHLASKATGADCTYIDKSSARDIIAYQFSQVKEIGRQILRRSDKRGIRESCTYTDTLHAMWFDSYDPAVREYIKKLVKGRIVLIGAKVDGVPDLIDSPVNGLVPGVYLFAMALDNYMHFGANYYQASGLALGVWVETIIFFVLIFLLTAWWRWVVGTRYHEKNTPESLGGCARLFFDVFIARFIVPLFLGVILVLLFWRYGKLPLDWVSLLGVAFLVSPVVIAEVLKERPYVIFSRAFKQHFSRVTKTPKGE